MVDFDMVKGVIGAADPSTPKGLRDQAILCALFGGGLRRSEVAALRVGDVRRSRNGTTYLYLRATKAKRDAEQALPPWAAKVITTLVQARLHDGAGPVDYLFISYQGQAGRAPTNEAVSASGIYKLFKHYCALSGAGPNLTPHSARATAITRLLAAGIPHRQVQEFSRHSSIQMVEVYDKRRIGVDENPGVELSYDEE
jgi:integrase/recombinase XerD